MSKIILNSIDLIELLYFLPSILILITFMVVWIEMFPNGRIIKVMDDTTFVVVWIEIININVLLMYDVVTTFAVVWIETY